MGYITVWGAKHPKDIPGGRLQQSAGVRSLSPEVQRAKRVTSEASYERSEYTSAGGTGGAVSPPRFFLNIEPLRVIFLRGLEPPT